VRRCPPRVDHALGGDQPYPGQLDDLIAPDTTAASFGAAAGVACAAAGCAVAGCAVAGGPGQPPGPPGRPVDRHSLIQPRGAGDRLPAGPRRHRDSDRHQRAGRHLRPSSPRWISSTPGTATTVSPCRTSSPAMPARDGSCSPPGPPTWSTCGWPAVCCERGGTVAATAAGAVMGHPAVAVAWLANCLGPRGERLRAGWLVLSGGLTRAGAARTGLGFHGRTGRAGFGRGLRPPAVIRFPAGADWSG
jgi:hypothetical protein